MDEASPGQLVAHFGGFEPGGADGKTHDAMEISDEGIDVGEIVGAECSK